MSEPQRTASDIFRDAISAVGGNQPFVGAGAQFDPERVADVSADAERARQEAVDRLAAQTIRIGASRD